MCSDNIIFICALRANKQCKQSNNIRLAMGGVVHDKLGQYHQESIIDYGLLIPCIDIFVQTWLIYGHNAFISHILKNNQSDPKSKGLLGCKPVMCLSLTLTEVCDINN